MAINKKNSILNYRVNNIIDILGEEPQLEGLHVFFQRKEITEIPFAYPYRSDNYIIHFVSKGEVSLKLNLLDFNLQEKDMIVIPPKTVIAFNSIEQVEIMTLSFSLNFALENSPKNEVFSFDLFVTENFRKLSVTDKQWDNFTAIALLLEKKNSKTSEELYRNEMRSHLFNLFLYELAIAIKNNKLLMKGTLSRKEDLTFKFLKLLHSNFKSQRLTSYYSKSLNVSSSHLTKTVKEVTGKTVGRLIDEVVIAEAKILMLGTTMSISQISEELHFSDQSFFGKFFKKRTGQSPSYFRKNPQNQPLK